MSAPNMFPIAGFFAVAQTVASHLQLLGCTSKYGNEVKNSHIRNI